MWYNVKKHFREIFDDMESDSNLSAVKKNTNCHDGHRERMRKKYIQNGADGLEAHELLEMLLYYCIPRRNTNEIAHEMIDHFGSLENLFSAGIDEIQKFDYISESGAILIKLVGELNRRSMLETTSSVYRYDTIEKVGNFLVSLYKGQGEEKLYLLMFDSGMRLLDCTCICEGGVGSVGVNVRKIVEHTISAKASNIIIAHNHPGGIAVPSKNDISLTHQLETVMDIMDTKLLCHIIVAGDRYAPISNSYSGKFDFTI